MMNYEKAEAEVVYFTNRDVITTSGGGLDGGNCRTPGWERGNGCGKTSGDCEGQSWKQ